MNDRSCSAAQGSDAWPPLLPYQVDAVRCPSRFTWNNWSRQTGKSYTFTLRRLLRGMRRRRTQLLLSAGERQSRELMLKVREHCQRLRVCCELAGGAFADNHAVRRLEARLPNGVRILAIPANPATARGYCADVFLDEFAMHRDDREIWAALMPTLMRDDGELDIASTPRGRANLFYRLRENDRFHHSTLTLEQAIARGLDIDADEMRAIMFDERLYRQEFLCQFDDDREALLSYETITACCDPLLRKAPDPDRLRDRSLELFAGMDVGRQRDLTVIWLWQHEAGFFVTRGVIELPRRRFTEQQHALESVMRHACVRRVCIDATGLGMSLAEAAERAFPSRVEKIVFTPRVQADLAGRLRMLAEQGRLRIPADEAVLSDWHAVRCATTSAGCVRFRADRTADGHADRFWAAALGLHAAGDPAAQSIEYMTTGRAAFAFRGAM